jgi:FkbM family methyltransferase
MKLRDYFGGLIPDTYEKQERLDVEKYLPANAKVLEIGARFGVVSCTINHKLTDPTQHVVVEPDPRVWSTLKKNRDSTGCRFHIVEGALSSKPVTMLTSVGRIGAGSIFRIQGSDSGTRPPVPAVACTTLRVPNGMCTPPAGVPNVTYQEITDRYFVPDTLVVDCEGAFVEFFRDFPEMMDDAKLILIEWDAQEEANNQKYQRFILNKGFREIKSGFHSVYAAAVS